jgi:hypothetical protein
MESASACYICQQKTHKSDICPELLKELKPGFYKPSGGMPQGGGDDDEKLKDTPVEPVFTTWVATHSLTQSLNTNLYLQFNPLKI